MQRECGAFLAIFGGFKGVIAVVITSRAAATCLFSESTSFLAASLLFPVCPFASDVKTLAHKHTHKHARVRLPDATTCSTAEAGYDECHHRRLPGGFLPFSWPMSLLTRGDDFLMGYHHIVPGILPSFIFRS
jgi:hypothetical protein